MNDIWLCHADDHDCYRAWTVYGARPSSVRSINGRGWPPEVRESVEIARAKLAADELMADGPDYFEGDQP